MYFVTDEPILFSIDSGVVVEIMPPYGKDDYYVIMSSRTLFTGTRQECEYFIYSIAGYVGAVNPEANVAP